MNSLLFLFFLTFHTIYSQLITSEEIYDLAIADHSLGLKYVTKRATIKEAKRNVWYAASGLCNPNKIKNWDCRLCDTLPNTKFIQAFSDFLFEIQGYVGIDEDDKSIFIVFRGLNSISNLLDTTYLLNTQFPDAGDTKIRVHLGIYRAMDSVSKQFLEIIDSLLQQEEYKNYNIKFIGHSMGGSIASLAAARTQAVLDLDWERISLFTYGQTRVGNSNFARWYNSKPLKTARVVQFADLIPRLPPRIVLDYTHHGNEIYLDRRGPHYCSNTALEDPNCSLGVPRVVLDLPSHVEYFGILIDSNFC